MPTQGTSPIIIVLIILAAVITLFAWWFSARTSRQTRALIAHLKHNQKSFWRSQLRVSRSFNPIGVIEAYRQTTETVDQDFDALYQARKSGRRVQISAICLAMALIALVLVGTHLWGWSW